MPVSAVRVALQTLLLLLCLATCPPTLLARTCQQDFYSDTRFVTNTYTLSVARSDVVAIKSAPNRILYFGGRTSLSASSAIVDTIDTDSNITTTFAPGMWEARHQSAGAVAGGKVLIAGGYAGGFAASSTVDVFNLNEAGDIANRTTCYSNVVTQVTTTEGNVTNVTNVTTSVPNNCGSALSVARSKLAAVVVGDWVLFAGGQSGSPGSTTTHSAVDIYNVRTGMWSVSPTPLADARYFLTATAIDNQTVLFCGGGDETAPTRACEVYELRTNGTGTWVRILYESPIVRSNLGLFVGRFAPVALLLGGRVVIAGGQESGTAGWSRRVDFFDITKAQADPFRWVSAATALSAAHENIGGAALGTLGVFAGKDRVDIYDPATNTWRSVVSAGLSLVSPWAAVGVAGTRVFFAGWSFADRRVLVYDTDGCAACPAGSTAPAGSVGLTNCSCLPGRTGAAGGPCTCCDVATHKEGVGSLPCLPCPVNSRGSLQGAAPLPVCSSDPDACCDPTKLERLLNYNPQSAAAPGICANPAVTTPAPILNRGAAPRARLGLAAGAALLALSAATLCAGTRAAGPLCGDAVRGGEGEAGERRPAGALGRGANNGLSTELPRNLRRGPAPARPLKINRGGPVQASAVGTEPRPRRGPAPARLNRGGPVQGPRRRPAPARLF